jgi:hypothetical protein
MPGIFYSVCFWDWLFFYELGVCSYGLLGSSLLDRWTQKIFLSQSLVDKHLGGFQVGTIISKVSEHSCTRLCVDISFHLGVDEE